MSKITGAEDFAFPLSREQEGWFQSGMTLRDWFAGQCLPELIRLSMDRDGGWSTENAAAGAYNMADAMLEARKL